MRLPVSEPYKITLGYGATTAPYSPSNPHGGVDFSGRYDRGVYAPQNGRTVSGRNNTCGIYVVLYGSLGTYKHTFCHLSEVYAGSSVKEGEKIGKMGTTGYSTGVHLHWHLRRFGIQVNPLNYVEETSMASDKNIREVFQMGLHRNPDSGAYKHYRGHTAEYLISSVYGSAERKNVVAKMEAQKKALADATAKLAANEKELAAKNAEIEKLKTQLLDTQAVNTGLQDALKVCEEEKAALEAENAKLVAEVDDLRRQLEKTTNWVDGFIEWFKSLFNRS